jgi:hypothetical protein
MRCTVEISLALPNGAFTQLGRGNNGASAVESRGVTIDFDKDNDKNSSEIVLEFKN